EPRDQAAVLRDVVRRGADRLAAGVEHVAVLALEHVAVRGGAGVPARPPVRREPGPHGHVPVSDTDTTSSRTFHNVALCGDETRPFGVGHRVGTVTTAPRGRRDRTPALHTDARPGGLRRLPPRALPDRPSRAGARRRALLGPPVR